MSIRLQVLQVARLAPNLLRDSAELVAEFVRSQQTANGGFADREGRSDLYYSVFGLEDLVALRQPVPTSPVTSYLGSFGRGDDLDFVHLCCLARAWASVGETDEATPARRAIPARLEGHRTPDGGYNAADATRGSAYGAFMALGAYQDVGGSPPDPHAMVEALDRLRTADGGYANEAGVTVGNVPATAAAVAVLHQLGRPIPRDAGDFLMGCHHREGGFFPSPSGPVPDLLATATALHALVTMHRDIAPIKEPCLDFLDTLWTSRGGFLGNWADATLDLEYTFYGLLALGHLSL